MKARSLLTVALLLGVAAGAAYLISGKYASRYSRGVEGSPLFASLPVNEVSAVEFKSAKYSALLHKKENRWTVANRSDYPADYGKITTLIVKLKDSKILRAFDGTPDVLARLTLKDVDDPGAPDAEKGMRVELKDQKGSTLATVLLGLEKKATRDNPGAGGWFVKLPQDQRVFAVDKQYFAGQGDPAEWLDRVIVNVTPDKIKRFRFLEADSGKVVFAFERADKGAELMPVGWEPARKLATDFVYLLGQALSLVAIEDVFPQEQAAATGADFPYLFEYETFDGLLYRIKPSKRFADPAQSELCFLRIDASCAAAPPEASSASEDCASRAKDVHQRLSPWIYKVNLQHHYKFVTDPNLLLEREVVPDVSEQ